MASSDSASHLSSDATVVMQLVLHVSASGRITNLPPPALCFSPVLGLGSLPSPASLASIAVAANSVQTTALSWATGTSPIASLHPAMSSLSAPNGIGVASSPQAGLLLSPASEVIPKKLVDKIRSGQFVEMKELLADNIS